MKKFLLTAAFACFALFSNALDVVSAYRWSYDIPTYDPITEIRPAKLIENTTYDVIVTVKAGYGHCITIKISPEKGQAIPTKFTVSAEISYPDTKAGMKKATKLAQKIVDYLAEQDLSTYYYLDDEQLKEAFTKIEL